MTYEQALAWTKTNRDRIVREANEGHQGAQNLISLHRMLVTQAERAAAALFEEQASALAREWGER